MFEFICSECNKPCKVEETFLQTNPFEAYSLQSECCEAKVEYGDIIVRSLKDLKDYRQFVTEGLI